MNSLHDHAVRVGGPMIRTAAARTSRARVSPSLIIAGTQRGGTTSLFRTLQQHPGFFGPVRRKGIHYFDVEFERGPAWYVGHFPFTWTVRRRSEQLGYPAVVGEASPFYMAHPLAPARIHDLLPEARIVVLLRDPIERAYSAYAHERARGFESRDFEVALREEPEMVARETARILADPTYRSQPLRHHAYLGRGEYVTQVRRLEALFGRDRLLVLDSGLLFTEPEPEFSRLFDFAGLPDDDSLRFERHNARPRRPLGAGVEGLLRAHFEPWDRELAEWLGREPSWVERTSG